MAFGVGVVVLQIGRPTYKPSFPAEFSRNKLPSRMYRLTICTDRCPV